ncbi:MAG: DUF1080 domain-containing protein [Anaerohalosphaeraceae bacterium]
MNKKVISKLSLAVVVMVLAISGCGQKQRVFSGKDLTGWAAYPANTTGIWSVKDGIIHCEGKPNGYIRTEQEYSNYHLHLEWRWVQTPTNSGVLLHTTGPDTVWPNSIEAQLMNGNAGDIYLIGEGLSVFKINATAATDKNETVKRVPKLMDSSENAAGEWNTYDIFCKNNSIKLFVNGFLQNEVSKTSKTAGSICLQSEGSPIEFKNIYLEPLK